MIKRISFRIFCSFSSYFFLVILMF